MSELHPQNKNEQPDDINEELLDDQYLEEGAELDTAEDFDVEPGAPYEPNTRNVSYGDWAKTQPPESDPAEFTRAIASSHEALEKFGSKASEEQARTVSESAESAVDSTDKGLSKSGRKVQIDETKPEEDVDTAREAVEKSLKSEETTDEEATAKEPTPEGRTEASEKISETAHTAARRVKEGSKARRARKAAESRTSVNEKTAEAAAKKTAQETAPQTPPIMGERDGANEKPAKQTVVSEGTDGQEYVTEPTTERPKQARVPKEAATEARQVPEAVIPTQEQPQEPEAPAEEPKKVVSGAIVEGTYGSAAQDEADFRKALGIVAADEYGIDPKDLKDTASKDAPTREESIDEDVLAAMGGYDSGRPASKRRGGRKTRREEAAEVSADEAPAPSEPVDYYDPNAEPRHPRRPSPADMPGARRRGPSPADMPRRRPATESVDAQAPTPEAAKTEAPVPTPETPSVEDNEWGTFAPEVEYGTENYKFAFGSRIKPASYRSDPEKQKAGKGENEDNLLIDQENGLIGAYDGMGSNSGKEARDASYAAAKAVLESWNASLASGDIRTKEDAVAAMRTAYDNARNEVRRSGEGTTTAITAKVMEFDGESYLIYGNAGDSRMFIYDIDEQKVVEVTTEQSGMPAKDGHKLFNEMIHNGFGPEEENWPRVEDEIGYYKLPKNARIMACTDGITGDLPEEVLSNEEVASIFRTNEDATPSELTQAFINGSKKDDDKAVVVMDVLAKEAAAEPVKKNESPFSDTEVFSGNDDAVLDGLDFETPDFAEDVLATAGNRDTRTPEEVEADDAAAAAAKTAEVDADPMGSMRNSARNRLGGFGDRSRNLGSTALGGEDTSWADAVFDDDFDDEEPSRSPFDVFGREPLDDPLSVTRRGESSSADDHEDDDSDDDEAGRSLTDDLLGDFGEPDRPRGIAAFREGWNSGWSKARAYFTGRDLDRSAPDIDGRIAKRQLGILASAVGATVLVGALFSALPGNNDHEGSTHVGKGPSASAEAKPGAKVDSGKTESKPSASPSASAEKHTHAPEHKESKKPSASVDDDHRHEHGTGTGDVSHTFDVGRETVKVSADNEVVVTLKQGGTVWDAIDKLGDELHINHSDEDIAETVQSMHLKPGQDRQMKVGSSYTFKVQGGKLVAKK
jgi:hypothetical protein